MFCLFVCALAFVIRHAKRMWLFILSSVACHRWQYYLPHYFINGTIFGKKLLSIKCVFWFSLQLLSRTFLILRTIQRDIVTNLRKYSFQVPRYSCQILMKLEFSGQIFEKCSDIKFHENPSSGSRVVPCGRTETTRLIVVFRNFANAPIHILHSEHRASWYILIIKPTRCTNFSNLFLE
jgi:hypothetical protein